MFRPGSARAIARRVLPVVTSWMLGACGAPLPVPVKTAELPAPGPMLSSPGTMLPADWLGQARWWEDFEGGTASWSLRIVAGQGSWRVERFGACGAALVVRTVGVAEAIAELPLFTPVPVGGRFRAWLAGQGDASASLALCVQGRTTEVWSGHGTPGWQPVPILARVSMTLEAPALLVWRVRSSVTSAVALDDVAQLQPAS